MPAPLDRRGFLRTSLAMAAGAGVLPHRKPAAADGPAADGPAADGPAADGPAAKKPGAAGFSLGFSLYGMNGLPLDEALRRLAEIGYRDVEPALMPGFSGDPTKLDAGRRTELRKLLESQELSVPALMENLRLCVEPAARQANQRRLALAAELGHALSPNRRVVVETVLGGKPADWPSIRPEMLDRLGEWADTAAKHDFVVAVKPHVSNALHLPDDCAKLIDDVGSPNLRAAFDYSHYGAQGFDLAESLAGLIERTAFIHVKDWRRAAGKNEFLLPGEGSTDYAAYFKLLRRHGYTGSVTVEVSSMIHSKPGYDPIAAAKKSYETLKKAYDASAA